MSEPIINAILIHPADNTVTLLREVSNGEKINFRRDQDIVAIQSTKEIPFGHKVAIQKIAKGEPVIKYGEVIGLATEDITPGNHVHVQNLESTRGRGDVEIAINQSNGEVSDIQPKKETTAGDFSERTFLGYPRKDGSVGTRNFIAVVSCVVCANEVARQVGQSPNVAVFTHQQGCSQTMPDVEQVKKVLVNLAKNPNVAATVFVSLGCESVPSAEVARLAAESGKPAEVVIIQKEGGSSQAIQKCREIIKKFESELDKVKPQRFPISKLKLGLKCGSSDTTQGISANVIAGKITDMFVKSGATVIIGETTEFMGAEHIAAKHAVNEKVGNAIKERVLAMENRAKAVGVDMRGGQPTRGNIQGGLTTIEEKSLGALAKAGTSIFQEVVDYGTIPGKTGLIMMDSPGREPEMLSGLAAAGCNIVLFTTGRGAPQGFPFIPVVKVTGNEHTWKFMGEHMDFCVSGVMTGEETLESAAERVFDFMLEVCSGTKKTVAEAKGYNDSMNIYVQGPVI